MNTSIDLFKLLRSINKHLESIAKNTEAAATNNQPRPPPIIHVEPQLQLPVEITEYYKTQKNETPSNRAKRFKTCLEIGAVVAALAITGLTAYQIHIANMNFAIDERAWLHRVDNSLVCATTGCINVIIGEPISVPVSFTNTGKTAARNIYGEMVVSLTESGKQPDWELAPGHPRNQYGSPIIYPGTNTIPIPVYAVAKTSDKSPRPIILTADHVAKISSGQLRVILHGRVTYEDIFGTHHWFTFCEYIGAVTAPRPTTDEQRACVSRIDVDSN